MAGDAAVYGTIFVRWIQRARRLRAGDLSFSARGRLVRQPLVSAGRGVLVCLDLLRGSDAAPVLSRARRDAGGRGCMVCQQPDAVVVWAGGTGNHFLLCAEAVEPPLADEHNGSIRVLDARPFRAVERAGIVAGRTH